MLFHTPTFAVFFLCVLVLAGLTSGSAAARRWMLIGASFVFYGAWSWPLSLLLLGSAVFNWAAALLVGGRRWLLIVAVTANLALLATFKYLGWFLDSVYETLLDLGIEAPIPYVDLILPIGISFYTFQGLSYVVDVWRRDIAPERSLPNVLLYIAFFPQLIAGPIVRAGTLLPQIARRPEATVALGFGLTMILGGLFKKIVLANTLATDLVDPVFDAPETFGLLDRLLAAYGYTVQIYCDFSGYSDMAIGLAALLGYRLTVNFDQPYRAASLREFWRRWHISLSTWLRDYLYIPLGGSRSGPRRHLIALFLTMILGGLWHGAALTFIIWGAVHGALLAAEVVWRRNAWPGPGRALGILLTFHVVVLTFAIFRSPDIARFAAFFAPPGDPAALATPLVLVAILLGLALHAMPARWQGDTARLLDTLPWWAAGLLAGLAVTLIGALSPSGVTPFIYFQF